MSCMQQGMPERLFIWKIQLKLTFLTFTLSSWSKYTHISSRRAIRGFLCRPGIIFRLHSIYEQQANDPTVKDKGCLLLISAWILMGKGLLVKCLKLCSCCLVALQFHGWSDCGWAARQKIKLKDCVQQIWHRAEFHKYAQLAECSLICIQSNWNKWFVTPQSTDFYNMNWNKVIDSNLVIGGKKKERAEPEVTWGGSVAPQLKLEAAQMRRQGEVTGGDGLVSEEQHWSQRWKKKTLKRWRDRERETCSLNQADSSGISN